MPEERLDGRGGTRPDVVWWCLNAHMPARLSVCLSCCSYFVSSDYILASSDAATYCVYVYVYVYVYIYVYFIRIYVYAYEQQQQQRVPVAQ